MIVHVSIFATRRKSVSIRREIDRMDGSEMAVNLSQLLVEDDREEAHLKAALAFISGSHIASVLTPRAN